MPGEKEGGPKSPAKPSAKLANRLASGGSSGKGGATAPSAGTTGGGGTVRQSVRPAGSCPKQKQKPSVAAEGGALPVTVLVTAGSRVGATPSPSLPSRQLPPQPTDKNTAAAAETPLSGSEERAERTLRTQSSAHPHGAFVRIVDCGVTAEQGTRSTMEDQHTMLPGGIPFFAVYDGHAGTQCAEYLRDNLHTMILNHREIKTNPEKAIFDSVVKADDDFLHRPESESNDAGSVCAIALIIDDTLVVGNVGDCEAVLCRSGSPILLTVKHTLGSNPSEMERVTAAGGRVYGRRVGHPRFNPSAFNLAVTRAIGDAGFKLDEFTEGKHSGIIADPDTKSIKLVPEDEFLIIGCDGLWDVMSYEEVVDFCVRRFNAGEVAQTITDELAQAALNRGGTDNVTAMLVPFACRRDGTTGQSGEVMSEVAVSTSVRNLSEEA